MKKSFFIAAFAVLVSSTAQANTIDSILERLDNEVQEAREEVTQPGRRSHRFNKQPNRLAIQRNVVRPTRGDITVRKDTESLRRNIESENQLDYAIKQRQKNHFVDKYVRTNETKNRLNQIEQHKESRFYGHAPETSTQMKRTGELKDVPNYESRRHFNTPSTIRKNSKQIFRRRAVDYYFNGGYADTAVLRTGVIKGSTYQVPRDRAIPTGKTAEAQADVLGSLRAHQKRNFRTLNKVPTGHQTTTHTRAGGYGRTYTNPYQFQYLPE